MLYTIDGKKLSGGNGTDMSNPSEYGLPSLWFSGDLSVVTKDDKGNFNYIYYDDSNVLVSSGTCTLKWQGKSSVQFPKKNYNMGKISSPFEPKEGWGEQEKFTLKANWIDASHCRNIISARLWGTIQGLREDIPNGMKSAYNHGAVDGIPVIVMVNNEFHGLYTLNMAKEAYTYGMDGEYTGVVVQSQVTCRKTWNGEQALILSDEVDGNLQDFTIEVNTMEATDEEIKASFQAMLDAVSNCDGTDFTEVERHLDLTSVMDYMIFTSLIDNFDGVYKNMMLVTYDLEKWYFVAYDLDSTFGLYYDGGRIRSATNSSASFNSLKNMLPIYGLLWNHKKADIIERFSVFRLYMSKENVIETTGIFCSRIPYVVQMADWQKWKTVPSTSTNNWNQILEYYPRRWVYACKDLGVDE